MSNIIFMLSLLNLVIMYLKIDFSITFIRIEFFVIIDLILILYNEVGRFNE